MTGLIAATILKTITGRPMAKVFECGPDGALHRTGYSAGATFVGARYSTSKPGEFLDAIGELAQHRDVALVAGAINPVADPRHLNRRMVRGDDGGVPGLVVCPRRFVLLDFDAKPLPIGCSASDEERIVSYAISTLPSMFQHVAAVAQFGSSHGTRFTAPNCFSLHLWYVLDAPITDDELRLVYRHLGVDASLAAANAVHYTAPPLFRAGAVDPLRVRLWRVPGASAMVSTDALLQLVRPALEQDARRREAMRAMAARRAVLRTLYPSAATNEPAGTCERYIRKTHPDAVTATSDAVLYCTCPRHASRSGRTLEVDRVADRWFCWGCGQGGGPAGLVRWFGGDVLTSRDVRLVLSALPSEIA